MPPVAAKATDFVHVPGDSREWAPFEFLFKGAAAFSAARDSAPGDGLVFCPTRRNLPLGFPVRVQIRLGRRRPPVVLTGTVASRRAGRQTEKLRAGVGIRFSDDQRTILEYLLSTIQTTDPVKSRRRHERSPMALPVSFRPSGAQQPIPGTLRDIGRGGAFVSTFAAVPLDADVIVELPSPGAVMAMDVIGRVVWTGSRVEQTGFGVEWRARDAGGGRRIRELVRRLTEIGAA